MRYLKHLLSFLCLGCMLNFIKAKSINFTIWETEPDNTHWSQFTKQLEILKSGNDLLNLRLEIIENTIKKQNEAITENLEKMRRNLGQHHEMSDSEKYKNNTMPGEEFTHIGTSVDTLQTNRYPELSQENISEVEKSFMTNINGNEDPKICIRNNVDMTFMCSDITLPTSCADSTPKACWDAKCYIQNRPYISKPFWVSCDDTTDGGGWTVIQRRMDGSENFNRDWNDYKDGFGELDGEFWIGLDKLHALTNTLAPAELYVKLIYFNGVETYALYDSFAIGGEATKYVLKSLGAFSGDTVDGLAYHQNMKFTTVDMDNDYEESFNCADEHGGGWWYNDCVGTNVNGLYNEVQPHGMSWNTDDGDYLHYIQLMIRPRKL